MNWRLNENGIGTERLSNVSNCIVVECYLQSQTGIVCCSTMLVANLKDDNIAGIAR